MKYSIILPVRNGGEYIKACVNSILSQTIADFNLIILDNCSTDGTKQWVDLLNDSRIIVYTSERSLSIEESWGRIKDIEKNEFISLIGHDDILYPTFLEEIDRLITLYPDASLYQTHFYFINAKGEIIRKCKPMLQKYLKYEFLEACLLSAVDITGTGFVMRSKDYDDLDGIPVRYPNLLFADYELWIDLSIKNYTACSPGSCFAFRTHNSTSGSATSNKLHEAFSYMVMYLIQLKNKDSAAKKIIEENGGAFLEFCCKGLSHRLLRTPLSKRNGLTVKAFVTETKQLAERLGVQKVYQPERLLPIRIAILIDGNPLLRKLFLYFKKIYSKPVYTK